MEVQLNSAPMNSGLGHPIWGTRNKMNESLQQELGDFVRLEKHILAHSYLKHLEEGRLQRVRRF